MEEALIDNDFGWMAANRERPILAEWTSRSTKPKGRRRDKLMTA